MSPPSADLLDVAHLDVLTPEFGWAVQYDAAAGQLLRTEDGGRTWAALAPHLAVDTGPAPGPR